MCRAFGEAPESSEDPVIDWQASALTKPDIEKELHRRFQCFHKKTRKGRTALELTQHRKDKRERKKWKKANKAKGKTDDRTKDETAEELVTFKNLKEREDLEMKLAKWYEDYAAYVLSQGGSFFIKNYIAGAAPLTQYCLTSTPPASLAS